MICNSNCQNTRILQFPFIFQVKLLSKEFKSLMINNMEEPPSKKIKVNECPLISIEALPIEILCIIFLHLDKKSVKSATATCKLWFELIRNDSNLSSYVCLKVIKLQEFDKRIQDLAISVARWPALKTIKFCGHYKYFSASEIIVLSTTKLIKSKDCPPLEEIIVSVSDSLERFFPQFPGFGTIQEFTINPKNNIKFLQVEHITRLDLELYHGRYDEETDIKESRILSGLKLIGDTACNLKDITILARYVQQELIDCFQKSFCQMVKHLPDSLQRVKLKVKVLDDTKGYLLKWCEQCKNLRKFHIDVILDYLSNSDDYWIENECQKQVEKIFQNFTDVKIQFYLEKWSHMQQLAIVTKKPYQSKAISRWDAK